MGCPGCLIDEKEIQQQKNTIFTEAKTYAQEKGKWVVIYNDVVENTIKFMEAETAQRLNIYGQLVSPY